jgi:hypothetical protein
MSSVLPNGINNIISSYEDEEKYKDQINNTNILQKTKIIGEELKDIPNDEIIKFKLARQLAMNYIEKEQKKIDPSVLTGFFLPYLNIFTYDQLLNDYKNLEIKYGNFTRKFILGIDLAISDIKQTSDREFWNTDIVCEKLSLELANKLNKIKHGPSPIFRAVKDLIVKNNPLIYETTSYNKFLSEFEKSINEFWC